MSVKKLSFYIDTAKITVKSDHLPLKKFLEKNTLNSKVKNWAVELESQNITFEYIPMQGLSIPFACIGSGDPVRVLHLYTTNTLDTL